MVELILGLAILAIGFFTLIPGVTDWCDDTFQTGYWYSLKMFGFPKTDWHRVWSRKVMRIALPPFLILLGLAFAIGGVEELV